MNNLSLKNCALSAIACLLVPLIIAFPAYLAFTYWRNIPTLSTFTIVSAAITLYALRKMRDDQYGLLLLRLALLTITYLFTITLTLAISEQGFSYSRNPEYILCVITAIFSLIVIFYFTMITSRYLPAPPRSCLSLRSFGWALQFFWGWPHSYPLASSVASSLLQSLFIYKLERCIYWASFYLSRHSIFITTTLIQH